MPLFSVDIETTGLKPQVHSIFEMAVIAFNPLEKEPLAIWHRYVIPEGMVWTEYCLKLHMVALNQVLNGSIPRIASINEFGKYNAYALPKEILFLDLMGWMRQNNYYDVHTGKYPKMIGCGKNFGSFDQQFIISHGGEHLFKQRSLDVAFHFMKYDETQPPDLTECKKRAEAEGCQFAFSEVAHNAVADATDVMHMIQHIYKLKEQNDRTDIRIQRNLSHA